MASLLISTIDFRWDCIKPNRGESLPWDLGTSGLINGSDSRLKPVSGIAFFWDSIKLERGEILCSTAFCLLALLFARTFLSNAFWSSLEVVADPEVSLLETS